MARLLFLESIPFGAKLVDLVEHSLDQSIRGCGRYPGPLKLADFTPLSRHLGAHVLDFGPDELLTLKDAGEYIQSLLKATQKERPWQNATEAVLLVVNQNGPTMFARIGVMQALYPRGERVFDRDRKDPHWGKRKLKRDR